MSVTINKFDPSIAIVVVKKGCECYIAGSKVIMKSKYGNPYAFLPPGDWHLLFKGSEAREEDAMKVVDEVSQLSMTKWYMCYHLDGISYGYSTALEALQSLLRANGIHLTPEQDAIFIKK